MRHIYTRCNTKKEAINLALFIVRHGFEGVQNDSFRYCELEITVNFNRNKRHCRNFVYVGIGGSSLVVGYCKKHMRKQRSITYIEKERVFRDYIEKDNPKIDMKKFYENIRSN